MMHEPRNRARARWTPEMEPDRRSLQTLFAFAYGMQVGRMRRIAAELQKLAQQAQLATMASGAAIAIAAQNQIECIARSGGAAPQLGSKPEATVGLSGECIRTGIPQFCADTETHPFVDRMHSRTFGVRSIVYVPLFRGVQPAGVIGVFSDKPGHFTQHDMRVLQLIGREVTKTLKWEPNPAALFHPPTVVVTPPEPAVMAAAAAIPEPKPEPIETKQEAQVVDSAMNASPVEELAEDHRESFVTVEPLSPEHEEAILAEAKEILAADRTAPAPEPIAETTQLKEEVLQVAEATPVPETHVGTWAETDESEYPATVPSFLFSEDRGIPRWMMATGAVLAIGIIFAAVWYLMPLWSPKEDAMVYGPPQVTKDTPANGTGQTNVPVGDLEKVGARPSLSDPSSSSKNPKEPLAPLAYVKNIATQTVGGHTFVSVHLTGPAQFQSHQLTNPDRIYIDLHGVEVSPELKDAKIAGAGPIADFRFSKSEDNVIRLVMVLDAPCTSLVSVTSDPYVIVFDVQPLRMPRPGAAKRASVESPGL